MFDEKVASPNPHRHSPPRYSSYHVKTMNQFALFLTLVQFT